MDGVGMRRFFINLRPAILAIGYPPFPIDSFSSRRLTLDLNPHKLDHIEFENGVFHARPTIGEPGEQQRPVAG
jgi:hypothetical protein